MSGGLKDNRSTWWNSAQDDMTVLASKLGYRPDDHADLLEMAAPLTGEHMQGAGRIENVSDVDYFSVDISRRSEVRFSVDVTTVAPNLRARVAVYAMDGELVADSVPYGTWGVTVTATLSPGQYFVGVSSFGDYGDVGQYTVSGNMTHFIDNGVVSIDGADDYDHVNVETNDAGQVLVNLTRPNLTPHGKIVQYWQETFDREDVHSIACRGYGGDDEFLNATEMPTTTHGGSGDDRLEGGYGNDSLDGGYDQSSDRLIGGAGTDTFVQHRAKKAVRSGYITYWYWQNEDVILDAQAGSEQVAYVNH